MYYPDVLTDDLLNELERRIKKEYKQAAADAQQMAADYFADFRQRYVSQYAAFQAGKYTPQEFNNWVITQLARGDKWNVMSGELSDRMCQANRIAAAYINDDTPGICSLNYLFEMYNIDKNIQAVTFNIYDEQTIRRLIANDEIQLPHIEPNYATDYLWNKKKMNSALIGNILTGKGIDDLAKSFESVTNMNRAAAMRNARTAYTGAQNAGRYASYVQMEQHGVKTQKQWIATFDDRTRVSHADLHGAIVDNNAKFDNGLRYPGDMQGAPSELYNCRCTMKAVFPDVKKIAPKSEARAINSKENTDKDFKRWADNKLKKQSNNQLIEDNENLFAYLERIKADYKMPAKYDIIPSEKEIISKIADRWDPTMGGACTTQAITYIGNLLGYDMRDYGDGFAHKSINTSTAFNNIARFKGVNSIIESGNNDIVCAAKLIKKIEPGKEYLLATGTHSAFVRQTPDRGLEYLELQKANGGWVNMGDDIAAELKWRFYCKENNKSVFDNFLIEKESLMQSEDIVKLLGYVNTK